MISIHALLAESDAPQGCYTLREVLFLSTLSLRRATVFMWWGVRKAVDFYPRSPCGERPHNTKNNYTDYCDFYPRSPCGERRQVKQTCREKISISIHALLAESDYDTSSLMQCQAKFLSTLSLRRATDFGASRPKNNQISIHALLAESD